jgi:hypothetical protein
MPSTDKEKLDKEAVLDKAAVKMVEAFRRYRDVYKAAEKAGIAKTKAVKVFNSAAFQDELERQEEAVRLERARQEARDEKLTNEVIDRELLRVILLDVEKHGTLKLDAIRLGAVMTGRIQAGNTRALDAAADAPRGGGFYQALVQVSEAAPIVPSGEEMAATAATAAAATVSGTSAAPIVAAAVAPNVKAPANNVKRAQDAPIRLG